MYFFHFLLSHGASSTTLTCKTYSLSSNTLYFIFTHIITALIANVEEVSKPQNMNISASISHVLDINPHIKSVWQQTYSVNVNLICILTIGTLTPFVVTGTDTFKHHIYPEKNRCYRLFDYISIDHVKHLFISA